MPATRLVNKVPVETLTAYVLRRPDLEKHLQIKHAKVMAKYKKDTQLGNVWPDLKDFILKDDPNASKKYSVCMHVLQVLFEVQ